MRIIHRSSFSPILPALILSALLLSACGQTGPLYLPGDNSKGRVVEPTDKPVLEKATQQPSDKSSNNTQVQ